MGFGAEAIDGIHRPASGVAGALGGGRGIVTGDGEGGIGSAPPLAPALEDLAVDFEAGGGALVLEVELADVVLEGGGKSAGGTGGGAAIYEPLPAAVFVVSEVAVDAAGITMEGGGGELDECALLAAAGGHDSLHPTEALQDGFLGLGGEGREGGVIVDLAQRGFHGSTGGGFEVFDFVGLGGEDLAEHHAMLGLQGGEGELVFIVGIQREVNEVGGELGGEEELAGVLEGGDEEGEGKLLDGEIRGVLAVGGGVSAFEVGVLFDEAELFEELGLGGAEDEALDDGLEFFAVFIRHGGGAGGEEEFELFGAAGQIVSDADFFEAGLGGLEHFDAAIGGGAGDSELLFDPIGPAAVDQVLRLST